MFPPFAASSLAFLAVLALLSQRRHVRGTTLVGPWLWGIVSLLTLLITELYLDWSPGATSPSADAWRFLAAASTLCPGIALLGAKRPQDRAWQWVVGSFWTILSLPALQQIVMNRGGMLEIHPARAWFMLAIAAFCATNSLFCRRWPQVILIALGQALIFGPHLATGEWQGTPSRSLGISLISLGAMLLPLRRATPPLSNSLDRTWIDFRQLFGLVWTLRFMERINAVSNMHGWDLVLAWDGFRDRSGGPPSNLSSDQVKILRQTLRNLLRRFLSPEWIRDRLGSES